MFLSLSLYRHVFTVERQYHYTEISNKCLANLFSCYQAIKIIFSFILLHHLRHVVFELLSCLHARYVFWTANGYRSETRHSTRKTDRLWSWWTSHANTAPSLPGTSPTTAIQKWVDFRLVPWKTFFVIRLHRNLANYLSCPFQYIMINPRTDLLKPGEARICKITFVAIGMPAFYDIDLVCEVCISAQLKSS